MKKKLALMILAAAFVFVTGCAKTPSDSGGSPGDQLGSYTPPSDLTSDTDSGAPKNKGEPSFLVCPDGMPVYTSEIKSIYTGSDITNDRREITLDEAEKLARDGGDFTVICSGFVYAYIPENALNRIDNPDLFSPADDVIGFFGTGNTEYFGYTGGEISPSTEFVRLETGDKVGALTVKSSASYFGNAGGDIREFSDQPGNFLRGGSAEFDGELELSGYVSVSPFNEFYNLGGYVTFCPDSKSCAKLPMVDGRWESSLGEFVHSPFETSEGYYGDFRLDLGNIDELAVDTGELKYGDSLVKAGVVVRDIRFEFDPVFGSTDQYISLKEFKF